VSRVRIGRIGRMHGVRGEVSLEEASLTPAELMAIGRFTWRGPDGVERALALVSARGAHERVLARFEGFDDRDMALALGRGELFAGSESLPDPGPGTAYAYQLVGLRVRTEDGRELGILADIVETGANPVYVVRGDRERLLPAPPEFVRAVDLEGGVITLALPPGFEDL